MYARLIVTVLLSNLLASCRSHKGVMVPNYTENYGFEEATEEIGTEGGRIKLGAVVLTVPPSALSKPTRIVIKRYPAGEGRPQHHSLGDRYTAEPFLLRVSGDSPFVLTWIAAIPDDGREVSREQFCPKVSWTGDGEINFCYSTAGMVNVFFVEGKDLIKTIYTDSFGEFGLENDGCMSLSHKDKRPGQKVEFKFLTDRLGHFKILPQSSGDEFGDRLMKPLSINNTLGGKCVYVPPSKRRSVTMRKMGEIYTWKLDCKLDEHCEDGFRCKYHSYCVRKELFTR